MLPIVTRSQPLPSELVGLIGTYLNEEDALRLSTMRKAPHEALSWIEHSTREQLHNRVAAVFKIVSSSGVMNEMQKRDLEGLPKLIERLKIFNKNDVEECVESVLEELKLRKVINALISAEKVPEAFQLAKLVKGDKQHQMLVFIYQVLARNKLFDEGVRFAYQELHSIPAHRIPAILDNFITYLILGNRVGDAIGLTMNVNTFTSCDRIPSISREAVRKQRFDLVFNAADQIYERSSIVSNQIIDMALNELASQGEFVQALQWVGQLTSNREDWKSEVYRMMLEVEGGDIPGEKIDHQSKRPLF